MDTLILGLLTLKELTVYEIRAFLRKGMYLAYSDSMGSIQAALKKLLAGGHIAYREQVDKGKNKKIYTITESGRQHFSRWLAEPFACGTNQSRNLSKLFFMGMLPEEKREELLAGYTAQLEGKLEALRETQRLAVQTPVDGQMRDIAQFQLATISLAVEAARVEKNWYETLLDRVRKGESPI